MGFTDSLKRIKVHSENWTHPTLFGWEVPPIQIAPLLHTLGKRVEMKGGDCVAHYRFHFQTIHFKVLPVSGMWQVLRNYEFSNRPYTCLLWAVWKSREVNIMNSKVNVTTNSSMCQHKGIQEKDKSPWAQKLYLGFHWDHISWASTPSSRSGKSHLYASSIWELAWYYTSLVGSEFSLYLKHLVWFISIITLQMTLEYD